MGIAIKLSGLTSRKPHQVDCTPTSFYANIMMNPNAEPVAMRHHEACPGCRHHGLGEEEGIVQLIN
jgi:hypothetical protein